MNRIPGLMLAILFISPISFQCRAQDAGQSEPIEWGTDTSKINESDNVSCAALDIYERKLYPRPCSELNQFICSDGKSSSLQGFAAPANWRDSLLNCVSAGTGFDLPNAGRPIRMPRIFPLKPFAWVNYKKFFDDQRHRDPADRRGEHWMSVPVTGIQRLASLPAAKGNCAAMLASGPTTASCDTPMHEVCVREKASGLREWNATSTRSVYFAVSDCPSLGNGFRRGVPSNNVELAAVMQEIATRNLAPAWIGVHVQHRPERCVTPETFALCSVLVAGSTLFWGSQALSDADAVRPPTVVVNAPEKSPLPWHLAAINLNHEVKISPSIAIGVLDSGIEFSGLLSKSKAKTFNYTSDSDGASTSANEAERVHGTTMASIIAASYGTIEGKPVMGIAPGIKLVSHKIVPNAVEREVGVKALSSAIEDATAERPDQDWPPEPILNVSFASQGISGVHLENLRDRLLAVGKANKTLIVASVGNDGLNIDDLDLPQWNWPAAYKPTKKFAIDTDPVIRVAALMPYTYGNTPQLFQKSRHGAKRVDIAAPGVDIASFGPGGRYYQAAGTSPAAAIVSGVLALMKSCAPAATASELKSLLLSNSDRHAALANDVMEGRVINAGKAIAAACAGKPDNTFFMR